jgi:hypothetical protein
VAIHDGFDEGDDPLEPGLPGGRRSGAKVGAASRTAVSADGVDDPQRGHTEALSSSVAAQVGQGRTAAL